MLATLLAQLVLFGMAIVPSFLFSCDTGRDIGWRQKPFVPLLLSAFMASVSTLFGCVVIYSHSGDVLQAYFIDAAACSAIAWALGNIVGYVDELNGAKLRWVLSAG